MKLNCLVVDDEPLARKGMVEYIRETDFLTLAGECTNATEAETAVNKGGIDLILLDVQMPGVSGLELLRTLKHPPMVIITSAFTEYALEGYELDVMDYLVKPIPLERFLKAVHKARDFYSLQKSTPQPSDTATDYFFVKSNGKFERIFFNDILFVEAMQNYVIIHLPGQKLVVYKTLTGIDGELPKSQFMRVHKSFIVSIDKVNTIEDHVLLIRQHRVPVSRSMKEEVYKRIMGDNLLHH